MATVEVAKAGVRAEVVMEAERVAAETETVEGRAGAETAAETGVLAKMQRR